MSPMNNFNTLAKQLLVEFDADVKKIGIFPGAFKPPHIGHFVTALKAVDTNDIIYIYVSNKSRDVQVVDSKPVDILKPGKESGTCDSSRYKNLVTNSSKRTKFTDKLLSVRPAMCSRMSSATAVRTAIATQDKQTVMQNIPPVAFENLGEEGLEMYEGKECLTDQERDSVFNILRDSHQTYSISSEQSMNIWAIYKAGLERLTGGKKQINISLVRGSPVKETYDLVDNINNSDTASNTAINLYVGV